MVAEFETGLIGLAQREGMSVAKGQGRLGGKQPKMNHRQEAPFLPLPNTRSLSLGRGLWQCWAGRSPGLKAWARTC